MNHKYVIAVAGGTNLKGDIVTEYACRDAAEIHEALEFCEMTGNLYFSCPDLFGDMLLIPYPSGWIRDASIDEPEPFDKTTAEMMKDCLGHLG